MARWRLWLGRLLVLPLAAMSGGLLFSVYRSLVTGQLTAFSTGWRSSSREILFADSPLLFSFFLLLSAAFACALVAVTVLVARLFLRKTRAT
jgi:hypothetical protein